MNTDLEQAEDLQRKHTKALYILLGAARVLLEENTSMEQLRPYIEEADAAEATWHAAIEKLKHDGAAAR